MPRLQLTDQEAALIEQVRKDRGLIRKGILQALNIVLDLKLENADEWNPQGFKQAATTALETAIKELR